MTLIADMNLGKSYGTTVIGTSFKIVQRVYFSTDPLFWNSPTRPPAVHG